MPSKIVKAIETAEQQEYRLECLGPTNDELKELKAKHPPQPQLGRTSLHTAIKGNDLASVKTLIRSGEFDVRATDQFGCTALHCGAWYKNNPDMIDFIVQAPHGLACLNARDRHGGTPLISAVENNHPRVLSALLTYDDIDVSIKSRWSDGRERTALESATREGYEDCVRLLEDYNNTH